MNRKERYTFKTSLQTWYWVRQILPNPDVVLRKRNDSIMIYRELLSDPHLTACLESRESATLVNNWELERNECPARLYNGVKDWFFNILERKSDVSDLSRSETIENALDVIFFGYQPIELVWRYESRLWMPSKILPKPPEWFTWWSDQNGIPRLRFLSTKNPIDGEDPPDDFTLMCVRIKPSYENPYGRGVASRCFWPIAFKKAGIEFWINFLERFGTPWIKGISEQPIEGAELTAFKNDLKELVQDAVVTVAGGRDVEILEAGQYKGSLGFDEMCDFMDSQITKTVLGHTLTTDAGERSSYAATRSAMSVRGDVTLKDTNLITGMFNDIIRLIGIRNGYNEASLPKVKPFRANLVDTERSTRDEALTRSGVRFSKNYFVKAYNFQPDDIDDVVDPKPQSMGAVEKETSTTPGGLKDAGTKGKRKASGVSESVHSDPDE